MSKINTTENNGRMPAESLEQGIERIRALFAGAPRKNIRIAPVGGDCCANTIEGGINGYMFALQRGVAIEGVPEPILEVLKHAGIDYITL